MEWNLGADITDDDNQEVKGQSIEGLRFNGVDDEGGRANLNKPHMGEHGLQTNQERI